MYADPPDEEVGVAPDGVRWYPHTWYDPSDPPDVFVTWRYHISLGLASGAKCRYLWIQDMITGIAPQLEADAEFFSKLDGIFALSRFHVASLPSGAKRKALVTPNALDPRYFVDGENSNQRFIYASSPNRGLEQVLLVWSTIRAALPSAEL